MRINDIVKTLTAYSNLQAGLTGRAVGEASKSSNDMAKLGLDYAQVDAALPVAEGDSVDLSGYGHEWDGGSDDSLGSIVESFIRQRQVYQFSIPGFGGGSPIAVTWEVEEAYRVIDFVPRGRSLDVQG